MSPHPGRGFRTPTSRHGRGKGETSAPPEENLPTTSVPLSQPLLSSPSLRSSAGVVSRTARRAIRRPARRRCAPRVGPGTNRAAPTVERREGRGPASPSGRAPSPGAPAGCATPPKGRFASPWRPPGAPSPVLLAGELPLNGETEKGTRAHPGPPKQQGRWRLPSFALAHGADCLKSESKMEADADVFAVHSRASGNPVYE